MDDLSSRLSGILNDPQSVEKIKNLAAMLGMDSSAGGKSDPAPPPPPPAPVQSEGPPVSAEPLAGLSSMPQMDPQMLNMMMKIMPALSSLRQEDDATRLLRAIRPFLGEVRRKKLDESIRLMQIVRMVPLLKKGGLF